ncbi:MAG TPA: aspartate aminotransferase family protein [Methylomirabilota bacterium]|nr:aspartate aminotransferase family protein [Methylomirabilota bacterium]
MNNQQAIEWSSKFLMDFTTRYPITLVRGEGVKVWDIDGKEYLDFTSGISVVSLGHSHPKVVGAIREQAATLAHVSNYFHIPQQIELAKLLVEHSFAERVYFGNSGAEAVEAAIKLARRYASENWASDRYEIITMRGGFHGRTLGALSATAQEKYQLGFGPMLPGFKYVPYNNLSAVEHATDARTAAILVEPIQGEGGIKVPDHDYLAGLRKLCDATGTLLIFDEVQTGVGRTGMLWAYQHWGVEPDLMTVAKALANGFPISAVLAKEKVAAAFTPGSHGTTFGGNPLATAVGCVTLGTMLEMKLPERAARTGTYLKDKLEGLKTTSSFVKEVRGKGLLIGVECKGPVANLIAQCREAGLLLLTAGENVARFAPPLIVEEPTIDRAVGIFETALARGAT